MNYLELFDRKPTGSDDIGEQPNKYRTNGILVIGNISGDPNKKTLERALRLHNSFLSRITIIPYNELYELARNVIDRIEKKTT
jgi:hypothetical protein